MCQGLRTLLVRPPRKRFMKPRLFSCSSSWASSYSPRRICLKTPRMPIKTIRLSRPSTHKNTPETPAPMTPVAEWSVEESSVTGPARALTPSESSRARAKTMVEWPRENQKPTDSGLRSVSSARSLRVGLAAAAMWAAAWACVRGEKLAGGVVDRRDVVGVEGVSKAEGVGQDADPDGEDRLVAAEREVLRGDEAEQDPEADDVEQHDEPGHAPQRASVGRTEVTTEPVERRSRRGF